MVTNGSAHGLDDARAGSMHKDLASLLTFAFNNKASDIHITSECAPMLRIHGSLSLMTKPTLSFETVESMTRTLLSNSEWLQLQKMRELDFSCMIDGVCRFRVNAYYQQGMLSMAFRVIPSEVPSIDSLGLPPAVRAFTEHRQGLVLVTGPTGSGKSSTLASMIRLLNTTSRKHIITLEDPIEFVHRNDRSLIDQREVGRDTLSFLNGLRASLRQDPDVILVGELRDLETIGTAITAAETGHLVLGTLHTNSAASTIERIIDVFPSEQQAQIRMQLGMTLKGVVAQQLLPTRDGNGRCVATEVMVSTAAVQNLIAAGKTQQLQNVLQTSKSEGMHTMDMSLQELVRSNQVLFEAAAPLMRDKSMNG